MSLTINLPSHIRDYLAREVAQGRFASEEAAIRREPHERPWVRDDITYERPRHQTR